MKRILYLSVLTVLPFVGNAQSLERQVFNSFGSVMVSGGLSLDVNAGEPVTTTYLGSGITVFQGFLQPEMNSSAALTDNGNLDASIHIWPNPATDGLYLSFDDVQTTGAKILLYDLMGKCIVTRELCSGCDQYYLELPSLATGMYRLRIAFADDHYYDQEFIKAPY